MIYCTITDHQFSMEFFNFTELKRCSSAKHQKSISFIIIMMKSERTVCLQGSMHRLPAFPPALVPYIYHLVDDPSQVVAYPLDRVRSKYCFRWRINYFFSIDKYAYRMTKYCISCRRKFSVLFCVKFKNSSKK